MESMVKKIMMTLIIVLLLSVVVACNGQEPAASSPPTAIKDFNYSKSPVSTNFKVSDLTIDPVEIRPGEELVITAQLTKIIDTEDSYTAELKINGITEAVEDVSIGLGEIKPLNFKVSRDESGTYKVALGSLTGTFIVVNPTNLAQTGSNENTTSDLISAPDFIGLDVVTNESISLKQFKGSMVLLNFVNYGCSSSLNQIVSAQLFVIRDTLKQRNDVVPLSVFCGCCPPDLLRDFATKNNFNWPWVLDVDNTIVPQYIDFLTEYGYPTLIIIDDNQYIRDAASYCDFFTLGTKLDEVSR